MFRGAYTALITPFKNGKIDYTALGVLVEQQISGGIDGLVPCGTTGESPTLTDKEHDEVIAFVVKAVRKRVPVIAGTGSNSTAEAIDRTRHAKESGADAALLAAPYYNKPNQRGLLAHFSAVADAVEIPQILYNIPGRSVININPETIAELARHKNIVAVKESSGSLDQCLRIKSLCPTDFDLISGDDPYTLPLLSIGGVAVISVTSHLLPGETSRIVHSYLEGKTQESKDLFFKYFELVKTVMGIDVNPVGIKTALALRGQIAEEFRLPLIPITADGKEMIRKQLEKYNLLSVPAVVGGSMSLSLAVSGATGRMGHTILGLAAEDPRFEIVGALEAGSSSWQGKTVSEAVPGIGTPAKVVVTSNLSKIVPKPQVLIDFTQPEATLTYLKEAQILGIGLVIGTTGLSDSQKTEVHEAAKKIPILMSTNMSVGMNLLFALVEEAAPKLGESHDVEIIEAHHHFKKDAPSGSALSLGESVARAWKVHLNDVAIHGREGLVGERKTGTIGFHAVRGGDIVGDHTVLYAGPGERLELKHVAHSRESFAQGALKAALFLSDKKNGFFDMWDVLGLRRTAK